MAVPVARVHLAMAHAAMPGLLPTPPAPLILITPSCAAAAVLPKQQSLPNNKTGRADAAERWDAGKNIFNRGRSSSKPAGRADAVDRWDAGKKMIAQQASIPASSSSSAGSSSSGRSSPDGKNSSSIASSCARWDSNKKMTVTSSSSSSSISSSSSPASRATSLCQINQKRWDSNKRPVSRGSSSSSSAVERWDAHKKKPRPPQVFDVDDDGESSTGSNGDIMEVDDDKPQQPKMTGLHYAGSGFLAPPEPSMLPKPPSFLLVPRPRLIAA